MQQGLMKLTLNNVQFYSYHGVKAEEQSLGGRYQVDADIWYNPMSAVLSDDVAQAVNYEEIVFTINELVNGDSFNLIETLCYEITKELLERFSMIDKVTIRVRKLSVPLKHIIDHVEVEHSMQRTHD
ncbi:MAG: dihydroneopterin aldolase [Bacteroidota bacterium]|nr:dihydroneopterin aldolase [bacterium]NBP63537.1 dihydroneopterin aldolase [Bacteroidota bacterium]